MKSAALGAFYGVALGDALGMPTQLLSRSQIKDRFGRITRFEDADPDHPIAANMPAGSITDDTEQAILVAEALLDGNGRIDPKDLAQRLTTWEATMRAKGSLDLLGPSTTRALQMIADGATPEESGKYGTTNGAAMRIAPIGIAFDIAHPDRFLRGVIDACQVTHNTTIGISSAAAVAAVISAGLNGVPLPEALEIGARFADAGEAHGNWIAGARIPPRLRWVRTLAAQTAPDDLPGQLCDLVGTSTASQESVIAAFGLAHGVAAQKTDPLTAVCMAASLGGDTDTIAAILGAMLGAVGGVDIWPEAMRARLRTVNRLDLDPLVDRLLTLRRRPTP